MTLATATAPPPTAPPPPKAKTKTANGPRKTFAVTTGPQTKPQRIGIYGSGGIGKSSLAASLGKPLFLDLEDGSNQIDCARVGGLGSWGDLMSCLRDDGMWKGYKSVVIDSATMAEELAVRHTLANVTNERGETVKSIEGYGYGKGLVHVYETFLRLFAELDRHIREGRNVVLIAHECTANVPNPNGEDFIRFEPRMQSPNSGKSSIRHRMKEWCDHLLFVGYDLYVSKDGKATGAGTRTIYPCEMPTHWAKSRMLSEQVPYAKGDDTIWTQIFGEGS